MTSGTSVVFTLLTSLTITLTTYNIYTILSQIPPTWALTRRPPTSSWGWRKKTGRWQTPHPGSTLTLTYLIGSRTGAKFWRRRASIWAGTTLRWTSAARARTWVWPTRASTARATRATAASRETTSPGVYSGTDAPSPPGTATWKPLSMWRSLLVSGFTWTTQEASWLSTVSMTPWRSYISTRQSSLSLFTRLSGCPRRRTSSPWWHQGSYYDSKAPLLQPHLQTEQLFQNQRHSIDKKSVLSGSFMSPFNLVRLNNVLSHNRLYFNSKIWTVFPW